jgi:hypothetical protein
MVVRCEFTDPRVVLDGKVIHDERIGDMASIVVSDDLGVLALSHLESHAGVTENLGLVFLGLSGIVRVVEV